MTILNLIFVSLLMVAFARSDQTGFAQPDNIAGVHVMRSLYSFRFHWQTTTVQDVIAKFGAADRDVGSGMFILEYRLQDGSFVWIGSSNYSDIQYVRHGMVSIDESKILYRAGACHNKYRLPRSNDQLDW
jgi:hypothetical protein